MQISMPIQYFSKCGVMHPSLCATAEKIKIGLDNFFGPSWHAVIGEEFSFNIDYEGGKVYYIVYGSHAILVWKVRLS